MLTLKYFLEIIFEILNESNPKNSNNSFPLPDSPNLSMLKIKSVSCKNLCQPKLDDASIRTLGVLPRIFF